MSIEPQLLATHHLLSSEQTTFRLRPTRATSTARPSPPALSLDQTTQYQLYHSTWTRTSAKISEIVDVLQSDLLEDLVTFIRCAPFEPHSLIRQSIPTAVLLGSSRILNASLRTRIADLVAPSGAHECVPVTLHSRSCSSIGASIKSIVTALETRLERLAGPHNKKTVQAKNLLAKDDAQNIRALYQEYHHHYAQFGPSSVTGPKMVFIVDDFEGFDSMVLEDLIALFSNLLAQLPIVVVLSLNTSADAIHSLLPRTVAVRLQMTPFPVVMDGGGVTSLIQKVVLDSEAVFDLSSGVIRSLMDGYERLTKSLDSLAAQLQFIHLAFFHTTPLCAFFETGAHPLNLEFVAAQLRLTPSWQNARRGPISDEEMLQVLTESYGQRKQTRHLLLVAIDVLTKVGSLWPEKERTWEWVLYHLHRPELVTYALELCKLIKHSNDKIVMAVLTSLAGTSGLAWIQELERTLSGLMIDEEVRKAGGRSHLVNTHEPVLTGIKMFEADRRFSELVGELSEKLSEFLRTQLGSGSLLTLNEAWTFDDQILLTEVFHPPYVSRLKRDLQESPSPDLEKMYGLFLETDGKTINLADWFGAFEVSTTDNEKVVKKKKKGRRDEEEEDELMVEGRFLRCIADLGFIGFVGGGSMGVKKKECVGRLVW